MNYRVAIIEEDYDLSTDGTRTKDLDWTDPTTMIELQVRYKNKASPMVGWDGHPANIFSKIEIVNGSDVLLSASGKQLQAMYFYDTGKVPHDRIDAQTNTTGHFNIPIMFGRKLWDEDYALVPGKFANPQIKITHAKSGCDADLQSITYALMAYLFDKKTVSPKGFIMRKNIKDFVPVASSPEYTTMPTDYPYRQLFLQGFASAKEIRTVINTFELYEEQKKVVPIPEMEMYDWLILLNSIYPKCEEHFYTDTVAGDTKILYVMPTYQMKAVVTACGAESLYTSITEGDKLGITSSSAGLGTSGGISFGMAPHHMVPLLLHDIMDPLDWYDVRAIKKLELKTVASSDATSSHTGSIILEQERLY